MRSLLERKIWNCSLSCQNNPLAVQSDEMKRSWLISDFVKASFCSFWSVYSKPTIPTIPHCWIITRKIYHKGSNIID